MRWRSSCRGPCVWGSRESRRRFSPNQWLGGANVYVDEFEAPAISFGFDWLVLALLANTLVFVFIERVWPHRREQKTFRPEWKLDFIYYVFNHLMVSVVLLFTTAFSEGLFGWAVDRDPADLSPRLR